MSVKSYPPHVSLGSKPLSLEAAQELVAAYLKDSETAAHLHPDALLSTSDVQFAPAGGPQGGIILHNLRRVEAGLRGEVLKPELPQVSDDTVLDGMIDETQTQMQAEGAALKKSNKKRKPAGMETGWQDMEEYQQEQQEAGEEEGDLGTHSNFVTDGGEIPEVAATENERTSGKTKVDKEARKKAKKDRERQQKLEKEAMRKKKTDA